ncbi:MAG: gliding motility-associated C-terminal domain-containing protein, partial [Bacteroidia bacterium]
INWINTSCGSSVTCNTLCPGTYSLQLIDSVHCIDTAQIVVTSINSPSVTASFTNITCFGSCDGVASVTGVTGINGPPFTYSWSPSPVTTTSTTTSSVASGLCYTLNPYISTVTDSIGCKTVTIFTIGQPPQISTTLTASPATCFGINNGSIISIGSGGTPFTTGYFFSIDNGTYLGASSSQTFTALPAGSHTVCIRDSLICINCFPYNVPSNSIITSTISATKPTCFDSCNGKATVSHINGGTPIYTVTWSPSGQIDSFATALCAGSYTATITDALGCQGKDTIKIIAPLPITLNPDTANPACGQCNGTIILSPTGGTGTTYTYTWSPASIIGTGGTLLCPGNYSVVITDSNGCKINWFDTLHDVTLSLPIAQAGPNQSIFIGQTATLGGNPTNPVGGTIVWEPNTALSDSTVGNPIASPIVTTTFTVIVTNTLGCKATDTMVVIVFPPFTITTGFTPNNDGKNDTWVIDQLDMFPNVEVEIYNRWGEQLFYAPKGTYKPWNGTYQGQPVPVGTYYYIIRLNDKDYPDHYAGPLTILR